MRATSLDDFIAHWAKPDRCTVEADRATYDIGSPIGQWWALDDSLPDGFTERLECRRKWDQVVWADEAELVTVVWWTDIRTTRFDHGQPMACEIAHTTLEVWSSAGRFHDRLDELAGIESRQQVAV